MSYATWDGSEWSDWYNIQNPNGGDIEIVDDSTLGRAFRFTATELRTDPFDPIRCYPHDVYPDIDGPVDWAMKWSALFGPDSLPYGRNGNTSIGSNFSKIAFHHGDGIWASMMGVDVNHWDGLVLVLKDPSGQNWKVVKTNRALRYGSRYDFIVRTQGATIQLFVNGELWAQSEMHPDLIGVPPESAHAGLYGYGFPVGAYLFNGPMETDIWFR